MLRHPPALLASTISKATLSLFLIAALGSLGCQDDEPECIFNSDCPETAFCDGGVCQLIDPDNQPEPSPEPSPDPSPEPEPECIPADEVCNGLDDDCDGIIDNQNSPTITNNCAALPNTQAAACEAGACIQACQEGFVDLNADLNTERSDGCECVASPELCDGLDNDCDGAIDDDDPDLVPVDELCDGFDNDCDGLTDADDPDLDLARDCGATTGAQASCLAGACAFACATGFVDTNGDLPAGTDGDGCECQPTTPSTETCDNIDNDCDGAIDADDPDAPDLLDDCPSVNNASPVSCTDGACTFACDQGFVDVNADLNQPNSDGCECQPTTPSTEACDGIDNDCDGLNDADDPDFNLNTCPAVPGAQAQACIQGACIFACADDLVDVNGDLNLGPDGDGCECAPTEPSTETCDGIDNDCDGAIDAADPDFNLTTCPAVPGAQAQACIQGACIFACADDLVDVNGDLNLGPDGDGCECQPTNPSSEICDNTDNDCDGAIDNPDAPSLFDNCPSVNNASPVSCDFGFCTFACDSVFVDVNGDLEQADQGDGCECAPTTPSTEICDGLDNDCDGTIDADDLDFNLSTCPAVPGAQPLACIQAACTFTCADDLVDVNGDLDLGPDGDGCECAPTTPSTETCDGIDNDCDGAIDADDPDFNLSTCPQVFGAQPLACTQGACTFACADDLVDVNGDLDLGPDGDGCECQPTTPSTELCDAVDNDCDGTIDNPDAPSLLDDCPSAENASPVSCDLGVCAFACNSGFVDVNGDLEQANQGDGCECKRGIPSTELCDGRDNDCDGAIDAADPDFSLSNCPAVPGAQPLACTQAACTFACASGFVDINRDLGRANRGNGCECQRDNPSTEVCDGLDNDCDGATDTADSNFTPDLCALQQGVCQGATALCLQGRSLDCDEARYLNNDATFTGLDDTIELVCDGVDNNCRGDNDENCCLPGQGLFNVADPQLSGVIQFAPSIAASNQGVILTAWEEDVTPTPGTHQIRFRKFDTRGLPLGAPGFINSGHEPVTLRTNSRFWIFSTNSNGFSTELNSKELPDQGTIRDTSLRSIFTQGVLLQHPAAAAKSDVDLMVAWSRKNRCINPDALSCIRAGKPNPAITTPIELSEATGAVEAVTPAVLSAGAGWLVVWQDVAQGSRAVKWVMLNAQGQPTGPIRSQPSLTSALHPLDVVPTEEGFLIVYSQFFLSSSIHALPINHEGAPLSGAVTVTSQTSQVLSHKIVSLRSGLALMWAGEESRNVQRRGIFLRNISDRGVPSGGPVELLEVRDQRSDALAVAPVPDFGVAVMHAISDRRAVERARWSLLNLDGDALCLE